MIPKQAFSIKTIGTLLTIFSNHYDDFLVAENKIVAVIAGTSDEEKLSVEQAIDLMIDGATELIGNDIVEVCRQVVTDASEVNQWDEELIKAYRNEWNMELDPVHAWAASLLMEAN